MSHPFVLFGPAHLWAVALAFAVPLVLAAAVRLSSNAKLADIVRWLFAGLLIATYILWYLLLAERGWLRLGNILPMHLCDWAAIAAIITLLRPNQYTYEVAYFWALAGTLQATLTPELAYDFPDLRFVVFFAFHGGVIASVLYMTLGLGMRPVPASIRRVVGWTFVYAVAAGIVDWAFDLNFGYLRAKPYEPSLLDAMAPWPWYIGELALLAALSILIYYAPFFIADRLRGRKQIPVPEKS